MSFNLAFLPSAQKEWRKLSPDLQAQFRRKLAERLECPRVPAAQLRGSTDRYKIKLRASGYRLVYEVRDGELLVIVIAIGKRDRNAVYH